MDSRDIVDDVNALLKLDVGDPYRLEHIKQTFIQNKKIWITDENYLKNLREKYLVKHTSDVQTDEIVFENEPENKETIHCWKCGKQGPLSANFCMICGSSIFEVGANPQPIPESKSFGSFSKSVPLKIPIIVGIPVLILIILGAGYSQGYFDSAFDSSPNTISSPVVEDEDIFYGEFDSKCGPGTVLDPETNACRVGIVKTSDSSGFDSKCGPGTVFDSKSNSCILE
ncbi:MAG: zinc-ribbon domain-containing protein [Candidatus Nitrosopumilus sp. bin_7KS]